MDATRSSLAAQTFAATATEPRLGISKCLLGCVVALLRLGRRAAFAPPLVGRPQKGRGLDCSANDHRSPELFQPWKGTKWHELSS
jgi:hypothetical protein